MKEPVKVVAHLNSQLIEPERYPIMLDGILAWARALEGDLEPLRRDIEPVIPLPLDTWGDPDGVWGWKASRAQLSEPFYTTVEVRRKPATDAMARYGSFRKHHLGLGPHKARDLKVEAAWVHTLSFDAVTTNVDRLIDLLTRVTAIGKHRAIGYGHVREWQVLPSDNPEGWRARGWQMGYRHRPPYWHPLGRAA